jgi:ParB family chromosome partitioning protein
LNHAEHLANNELTTPIVVRPSSTATGKFEIIAGHHRVEAFKQLGRTEIEATIRQMDDQEAQKRIFFDNLMAPDLPDFEKYKGFAALRKCTGQSYDALAKDAGISKALVGHYTSYHPCKELINDCFL